MVHQLKHAASPDGDHKINISKRKVWEDIVELIASII
jgi:hypothetical protein